MERRPSRDRPWKLPGDSAITPGSGRHRCGITIGPGRRSLVRQLSGEPERDEGEEGSSQEPGLERPELRRLVVIDERG